jgi:hypothetical protein
MLNPRDVMAETASDASMQAAADEMAPPSSANDGRDGRRHAVLSVQGPDAGRLRQVRLHGGLAVQMFHGHVDSRCPSASHRCAPHRFSAERFMA